MNKNFATRAARNSLWYRNLNRDLAIARPAISRLTQTSKNERGAESSHEVNLATQTLVRTPARIMPLYKIDNLLHLRKSPEPVESALETKTESFFFLSHSLIETPRITVPINASTRSFSSSSNNNKGTETQTETETTPTSTPTNELDATVAERAQQRIEKLVDRVSNRLPRTDISMSDYAATAGAFILLTLLLVSPYMARQMRKSDNMYEFDDDYDPVAHIEKIFRKELESYFMSEDTHDESKTGVLLIDNTVEFISDVLQSKALQDGISQLFADVLDSKPVKDACHKLLKELWDGLVSDPETLEQLVQLLQQAIKTDAIRAAVLELVREIVKDKELFDELVELLRRLGQDNEVQAATQALLTESAHNALNDPDILDHSMQFATDVVGDDIVQRTSGEALRNTVTYAVRPGLSAVLSVVGVGFLLLSLSALGRGSAADGLSSMDTGAVGSAVARGLETDENGTILAAVAGLVSAAFSMVADIGLFPFHLIHRIVTGIADIGYAGYKNTTSVAGKVYRRILGSLSSAWNALVQHIANVYEAVSNLFRYTTVDGPLYILGEIRKAWMHAADVIGSALWLAKTYILDLLANLERSFDDWWTQVYVVVADLFNSLNKGLSEYKALFRGELDRLREAWEILSSVVQSRTNELKGLLYSEVFVYLQPFVEDLMAVIREFSDIVLPQIAALAKSCQDSLTVLVLQLREYGLHAAEDASKSIQHLIDVLTAAILKSKGSGASE